MDARHHWSSRCWQHHRLSGAVISSRGCGSRRQPAIALAEPEYLLSEGAVGPIWQTLPGPVLAQLRSHQTKIVVGVCLCTAWRRRCKRMRRSFRNCPAFWRNVSPMWSTNHVESKAPSSTRRRRSTSRVVPRASRTSSNRDFLFVRASQPRQPLTFDSQLIGLTALPRQFGSRRSLARNNRCASARAY
jgi:hypothetical protein